MATSKVFSGVVWSSIQRFGTMILRFITNIVLAHLLSPDDFGTIGMLMLFFALANTFIDSGFGSALIQKKNATQTDFSTVFYINLSISLVVYVLFFFGAPWVAKFYNIDILCPLMRVESLILIFSAFGVIQVAMMRKRMDFKKLSICNLVAQVVSSVAAIIAALCGLGVWSLVISMLSSSFITSLLLWAVGHWKPLPVFSWASFKELFGFGGFMLLSNVVYSISNNVHTLIIGKMFTPASLGNFTQARNLRNVATESVSSVISQVLYPDFANHQDDNEIVSRKLHLSVSVISFLVVGIMALCIVIAKPLILFLYGTKWENSILFFQILCTAGCFIALQDVNINLVAAKGKSKMLFYCNAVKIAIFMFMLWVGGRFFGLIGLVIANTGYGILAYFFFSILASHYLSEKPWKQYWRLLHPLLIALIPMMMITFINSLFAGFSSDVLMIIIDVIIFSTIYWFLSVKTNIEGSLYLNKMLVNSIKKRD